MKACNADAKTKALTGDERKKFMSELPEATDTPLDATQENAGRMAGILLVSDRSSAENFELDLLAVVIAGMAKGDAAAAAQHGLLLPEQELGLAHES